MRRQLLPVLLLDGGHIGYEVRKSERGRGYAKEILRRTPIEARAAGIERALLTAAATNAVSIRVIEAAGGVFDVETTSPRTRETLRRYWIDT